jgi:hypothetical protein
MQNGTDSTAPEPIVVQALNDLNDELQDVITGFELRLRKLKRGGDRAFTSSGNSGNTREESTTTIAPSEPEASILPVPDAEQDGEQTKEDESAAVPPIDVVVGKSQDQVLQAFENAGEEAQVC